MSASGSEICQSAMSAAMEMGRKRRSGIGSPPGDARCTASRTLREGGKGGRNARIRSGATAGDTDPPFVSVTADLHWA